MNLRGAVNELSNVIVGMACLILWTLADGIWPELVWLGLFFVFFFRWGMRRKQNDDADKAALETTQKEE